MGGRGLLQMGLGGGDVLSGSAVSLTRETRQGGILSFWSLGAQSHFSGREGALSLGGDVRTTMVGADYAPGPLVTGLSLSHSRGLGEYAGGQVASGDNPLSVITFQPCGRALPSPGVPLNRPQSWQHCGNAPHQEDLPVQ